VPGMTHGQIGGGHALGYDDTWVDFSWPRPRASLGGTFSGGAMMEGTHDDDDMVG
jgi:hypothetical protein